MSVFPRPAGNSVGGSEGTVPSRTEFPSFPYDKPYDIQLQLMRAVYAAVEHGQVGIMESPTGTGKTLSLICSVLQWLLDEHERQNAADKQAVQPLSAEVHVGIDCDNGSNSGDRGDCKDSEDCEPDWLRDYEGVKEREAAARVCTQRQQRLERRRQEREAVSQDVLGPGGIRWQHVQVQENDQESQAWWGRRSLGGAMDGGDLRKGKGVVGKGSGRKEGNEEPEKGREEEEEDEQFLVPEWESDDDGGGGAAAGGTGRGRKKRARGRRAARASDSSSDEESADGAAAATAGRIAGTCAAEALAEESLKVFFCSRTHSQLSQFISELRRTPFADQLFTVALASRKNLCINQSVLKLGNASAISEHCLELQRLAAERKSKTSKQGERVGAMHDTQINGDLSSALPLLPASLETCPYYAARAAARAADVVVLPYQSLLHKGAREALLGPGERAIANSNGGGTAGTAGVARAAGGVTSSDRSNSSSSGGNGVLSNSVVVVDEAHNLTDALAGMHSCSLSARQVHLVQAQLAGYLERFRHKLGAGNRRYVLQLQVVARCIGAVIAGAKQPRMQGIDEFLFSLAVDNINLFKLHQYVQASNIAHKISSYGESVLLKSLTPTNTTSTTNTNNSTTTTPSASTSSPQLSQHSVGVSAFRAFAEFFSSLCNANADGRVLLSPAPTPTHSTNHSKHSYNSSFRAKNTGAKEREGGSGSGVGDGEEEGRQGEEDGGGGFVKFVMLNTAQHMEEIAELGRLLVNVCSVAPGGIVVFFPSFSYLQEVQSAWQAGAAGAVLPMLEARKGSVFIEPRGAAEVEAVLGQYRRCIEGRGVQGKGGDQGRDVQGKDSRGSGQGGVGTSGGDLQAANRVSPRGAVLLCVMGGKMSEGINFSDDMGRAVVVVGQPFPSPSDPELNERMRFIDRLAGSSSRSVGAGDAAAGGAAGGVDGGAISNSTNRAGTHPSDTGSQGRTERLGDSSVGEGAVALAASLRSCGSKGRQLYEDICAKAVNQSIGRAIRHSCDYAAILLVDARYARADGNGITSKLPSWIKAQLVVCNGSFGEVPRRLRQFFRHNEECGKGK
ncbi:unnamed protein product [Closterium sp. NIES-53]